MNHTPKPERNNSTSWYKEYFGFFLNHMPISLKSCCEGEAAKKFDTQKSPTARRIKGLIGSALKITESDQKISQVEIIVGAKEIKAACKNVPLCVSEATYPWGLIFPVNRDRKRTLIPLGRTPTIRHIKKWQSS
jgi:hypothetical protein